MTSRELEILFAKRRPLWQALAEYDALTDSLYQNPNRVDEWRQRMAVSDYVFRTLDPFHKIMLMGVWLELTRAKVFVNGMRVADDS